MTRRIAVLTAGAVLLCCSGSSARRCRCPTSRRCPGPTYNTLGDIDGQPIIERRGPGAQRRRGQPQPHHRRGRPWWAQPGPGVRGWFDDEVAVVPEESVYPPDKTRGGDPAGQPAGVPDLRAGGRDRGARATWATRRRSSSRGSPTTRRRTALARGRGATPRRSTAGPRPTPPRLDTVLAAIPAGTTVDRRRHPAGQDGSTSDHDEGGRRPHRRLLGVSVLDQPSAPFDVDIQVEDVGGPSAGLMLTLGILDLVGDDDLTGGGDRRHRDDRRPGRRSGPIGGIPLKMVAARDIGAELFLVPAEQLRRGGGRAGPGLPAGQGGDPGRRARPGGPRGRRAPAAG